MDLKEYVYHQMVLEGSDRMCDGEIIPSTDKLFEEILHDDEIFTSIGRQNIDDMRDYIKSLDRKKLIVDIRSEAAKPRGISKALKIKKANAVFGTLFGT